MHKREELGLEISKQFRAVRRVNKHLYRVKSQSGNGNYHVNLTSIGFSCSCPDYTYRGIKCKHVHAVELSYAIRQEVENVVIPEITLECCPTCKSESIVKHGIRHNKSGNIQRYSCKSCSKWSTFNIGFERMHATPQMITSAMQLYFSGESFRNSKRFLELQGVKISHVAVYKWIKKYVSLMQNYLDRIKPKVGDAWRTDELYLKIRGNTKYLYAIMDDQTRYLIAQQVADSKYAADIAPMFRKAKLISGKRPSVLISDGAPNFNEAFKSEFFTRRSPRSRHIQHIRLQGDHNNNKMERFNGEVRDREKVMRGLKKSSDTKILDGYQIYHNYIRPHEGIGNVTPAEKCGIEVRGENKWKTLIQNAIVKKPVEEDENM
jgi:transposase-like protein